MTQTRTTKIRPKYESATGASHLYNQWTLIAFAVDTLITALALVLAYYVRFKTGLIEVGVVDTQGLSLKDYAGHILFGTILLILILTNFRFYTREKLLSFTDTLQTVLKSILVWLVAFLCFSLVLKFDPPISRMYCALGLVFLSILMPLWRGILWRYLTSDSKVPHLRQRAVVVGWSEGFDQALDTFSNTPEREFEIIGLIEPNEGFGHKPPAHLPVLGQFTSISPILEMRICQMVIVADDTLRSDSMLKLASLCEKEMIAFKLVPTCFRVLLSGLHLESVGGIPILGISKLPLHSVFNQHIKRFVDIIGAVVGLILAAPLIAIFGCLIYREDPGPIFYRQRRLGANGTIFDMIKLRSMKQNAEAAGGPGWTVKDDPRCLKVGALMRRLNIDEVPQFYNVLKGEMSLVGPRPERPELIEKFKEEIPHYNARHNIKPGITGWAQVNGLRGDTDLSERIRFDLHYIENWNVVFDIQIMALTFVRREGAC